MKFILLISILLIANITDFAYYKTDSLQKLLQTVKQDTSKVVLLNKLAWDLRKTEQVKAFQLLFQAQKLGEESKFVSGLATTYKYIGVLYYNEDKYDSALIYYNLSVEQLKIIGDKNNLSRMYHNIGSVYLAQTNYKAALQNYLRSLEIKDQLNDQVGLIQSYKDIGILYYQMSANDTTNLILALNFCKRAATLNQKIDNKELHANLCDYIGLIYLAKKQIDSALIFFEQEKITAIKLKNDIFLAKSIEGEANCHTDNKNYSKALDILKQALKIYILNNENVGKANVYNRLGLNYFMLNNFEKAIFYFLKSNELATQYSLVETQKENLERLSELFAFTKKFEKAYTYHLKYKKLNDSINYDENNRIIAQMQLQYGLDKKQKEDEIEKQKQLARLNQMRWFTYSLAIGFILMTLLIVFVYRNFRNKKKANFLLTQKNIEIEKQHITLKHLNQELSQQKEEITQQRDELHLKSKIIENKNHDITDSIHYARKIQAAVLPPDDILDDCSMEHFILYKPRDIVSGDFYWIRRIKNFLYIAVADCTGHGVPGAFMSMLGVSLLNETVNRRNLNNPDEVLNNLRHNLKKALWQTGKVSETKDGMDIALCVIDSETNLLQYAGANNELYIFRADGEFIEIKPDKMPVGAHPKEKTPFTNHEFTLLKGDTIYMFSDGYVDQFGGDKDTKFLTRRFKQMLSTIYNKPMNEQLEIVDQTIENWKGKTEQIDDISLMGLRIL